MQKVKEKMREQLSAVADADANISAKGWEQLSVSAAGFAAEEGDLQNFRPSTLLQQSRIIDAVNNEGSEGIGQVHPLPGAQKKAQADDKHWDAMFSAPQGDASDSDDSDAGSIDSDALFDPRLLEAEAEREEKWKETVRRLHEEKLLRRST